MQPIETQRLLLRRPVAADLADFLAYQTHEVNLRYQPTPSLSPDRAASFLARMASVEVGDDGGYVMRAVVLRGEGRVIGEVSLNLSPVAQSRGEIGWSFHPNYHRQGYATEAARAPLDYAFTERGLRRVATACDTRNAASFRLMERLGMRREGHLKQSQYLYGDWHDEYIYALLRDEWLRLPHAV